MQGDPVGSETRGAFALGDVVRPLARRTWKVLGAVIILEGQDIVAVHFAGAVVALRELIPLNILGRDITS